MPESSLFSPLIDHPGVVASVVLTGVPAHLSSAFDYLVPEELVKDVQIGVPVEVKLAGSKRIGWVVELTDHSDFQGQLQPILRVLSPFPLLTAPVWQAIKQVAHWRVGTASQLLRAAIPARHVSAEKAFLKSLSAGDGKQAVQETSASGSSVASPEVPSEDEPAALPEPAGAFTAYQLGEPFLKHLLSGDQPQAIWQYQPATHTSDFDAPALTELLSPLLVRNAGVLIVVPTAREAQALADELSGQLPVEAAVMHHELSAAERYRMFLEVKSGISKFVIGTRSAIWAPVADLELILVLGSGDDSLQSPKAPYAATWEIAKIRARIENTALILGSLAPSLWDCWQLQNAGMHLIAPTRQQWQKRGLQLIYQDEVQAERAGASAWSRLPQFAHHQLKKALDQGLPVLVSVRSGGYIPTITCRSCGTRAACKRCGGPLSSTSSANTTSPFETMACAWCGTKPTQYRCSECQGTNFRAGRIGADRTAEELGRAFPQIPVLVSSAARGIIKEVRERAQIVVATPGSEPFAPQGFGAALVLDTSMALRLPDFEAESKAITDWLRLRSRLADNGSLILSGLLPVPIRQALLTGRCLPFLEEELAERRQIPLPPAVWLAQVSGSQAALQELYERLSERFSSDAVTIYPPILTRGEVAQEARTETSIFEPYRLVVVAPWDQASEVAGALGEYRSQIGALRNERFLVKVQPQSLT
ncbi:hypothetical protein BSR28_04170 [Boudabousia liubingyangii]|uniref:primosomal protein N' family DNA-binding protein n=1 Tax=Boudabousia liubingyangii TaxID=1921764 RepID=UPI000938C9F5|nr:hypothetical protein [Boudabousia liubingyangii]OKL47692.1 hypothetical protein BSR28_04170 [Boudabousia liubingyangii]